MLLQNGDTPTDNPLEDLLGQHCRRWLLHADHLARAHQKFEPTSQGEVMTAASPPRRAVLHSILNASDIAANQTACTHVAHAQSRHINTGNSSQLLQLYAQELETAVADFIEFSESVQWHKRVIVANEGLGSAIMPVLPGTKRNVSEAFWWQIIDSGMMLKTGQALELVRVPHKMLYAHEYDDINAKRSGTADGMFQTLHVGSFHETLLKGCGILLSALAQAPVCVWRPFLEQMSVPQGNGFLLMLFDAITATAEVAAAHPLFFARPKSSIREKASKYNVPRIGAIASAKGTQNVASVAAGQKDDISGGQWQGFWHGGKTADEAETGRNGNPLTQQLPGTTSTISRHAAIAALHILRDLNDLVCQEQSQRRIGNAGVNGMSAIQAFLDSIVDLRAALAGALLQLGTLGKLADIYKNAEDLGVESEDLLPLLEAIVAVACTISSADLPGSSTVRRVNTNFDTKAGTVGLQVHVVTLLVTQLRQVLTILQPKLSEQGQPTEQLPATTQAYLSLLRHLCGCPLVFGGATPSNAGNCSIASHHQDNTSQVTSQQFSRVSLVRANTRREFRHDHSLLRNSTKDTSNGIANNSETAGPDQMTAGVYDLLSAVKLFSKFASCDIPFFCTCADSWLPTVKIVTKRLACEGRVEIVEEVTLTLCEVLCTMTTAMRQAAGTAAKADADAQTRVLKHLQKQLARGLLLSQDKESEIRSRLIAIRGHVDRPYGWGAGAAANGSGSAIPEVQSTQQAQAGSAMRSPRSPRSPRKDNNSNSQVPQSPSGVAALLPASPRLAQSTAASVSEQMSHKSDTMSELSAFWAALGYNADGVALEPGLEDGPAAATAAAGQHASHTWPGLQKPYIAHFEEILRSLSDTLVHLLRGFLLPIKWGCVPSQHTQASTGSSPGASPSPIHASFRSAQGSTIHATLGSSLFESSTVHPLIDAEMQGEVPLRVTHLIEDLERAGLLRALEDIFSLELMSDQLYYSHLAAVDCSLQTGGKLDRTRLDAACLVRDILGTAPQLATMSQGGYLLRSLRKFVISRQRYVAPHSVIHPLLRFTSHLPPRDVDLCHSMPDGVLLGAAWNNCYDMQEQHTAHGTNGTDLGVTPTSQLTAYCTSTLVALGMELLPVARVAASRADADHVPATEHVDLWSPSQTKSIGTGVIMLHTWPVIMLLMRSLLDTVHSSRSQGRDATDSPGLLSPKVSGALSPRKSLHQPGAGSIANTSLQDSAVPRSPNPEKDVSGLKQAAAKLSSNADNELVARARALAPLHKLMENWLQQLTQLLNTYEQLEAFQPFAELALQQGDVPSLIYTLLVGRHFSLTSRAEKCDDTRTYGSAISFSKRLSSRRFANNASPVVQEQRMKKDIERAYELSGTALVNFDELLCLLHTLCTPIAALQMANSGALAVMMEVVTSIHSRHVQATDFVNAMQAAQRPASPVDIDDLQQSQPPASEVVNATLNALAMRPGLRSTGHTASILIRSRTDTINNVRNDQRSTSPDALRNVKQCPLTPASMSVIERQAVTAMEEESALIMPRSGHWLLLAASIVKRAACAMSVSVAQLASIKLSTGSVASTAERYTVAVQSASGRSTATTNTTKSTAGLATVGSTALPDTVATAQTNSQTCATATATTTALSVRQQLLAQPPHQQLQKCRQLLIASKSSEGVGVEMISALAALLPILEPATQLKSMQVHVGPMSSRAIQTAHLAGIELANEAHVKSKQYRSNPPSPQHIQSSFLKRSDGTGLLSADNSGPLLRNRTMTLPPSLIHVDSAKQHSTLSISHEQRKLTVEIPNDAQVSSVNSPSPTAMRSPAQDTAGLSHKERVSIEQTWSAHASVMYCKEPMDNQWLDTDRLAIQRKHTQRVLEAIDQGLPCLNMLPSQELAVTCPALSDRPYLLGCCHVHCINQLPGHLEMELVLRRCTSCRRVWYCSEACRQAALPGHEQFCSWWASLVTD